MAVSGGGPAGSYCAYLCAQAGLSTVLIEREELPWTKVCAGGVLMRAASRLDFPIPQGLIEKEVRGFRIIGDDFQERFRFDRCLTYTVDRTNLDRYLFQQAERAGVVSMSGTDVHSIREGELVELTTSAGAVSARCAIIAEGATSGNARRLFGPPPRRSMAMGVRSILRTDDEPPDEIEVHMLDAPPRFIKRYPMFPLMGWMFPYHGRANFGVGGHGYSKAALHDGLSRVIAKSSARAAEDLPPASHPIPILPRSRISSRRIMLVGDSAGLVSPLSGEGLSHGLASSILASSTAADLISGRAGSASGYERAVKDTIIRDIMAAAAISPVLHWLLGVVDAGTFFRIIKDEAPYVEAWTRMASGEEDWRKLLLMTMTRFHRLFFRSLP